MPIRAIKLEDDVRREVRQLKHGIGKHGVVAGDERLGERSQRRIIVQPIQARHHCGRQAHLVP